MRKKCPFPSSVCVCVSGNTFSLSFTIDTYDPHSLVLWAWHTRVYSQSQPTTAWCFHRWHRQTPLACPGFIKTKEKKHLIIWCADDGRITLQDKGRTMKTHNLYWIASPKISFLFLPTCLPYKVNAHLPSAHCKRFNDSKRLESEWALFQ